jgi:hypothetical protein
MRAKMSRLGVRREILCGQSQRMTAMHLCKTMQATYNSSRRPKRGSRAKARLQKTRKQQNERETSKNNNSTACASAMPLGTAQARTNPGTLRLTDLPVKTIINQQAS